MRTMFSPVLYGPRKVNNGYKGGAGKWLRELDRVLQIYIMVTINLNVRDPHKCSKI